LAAQETGLPQLDPRELVLGRAGFTFINAAVTHTRPGGNRFNDDDRGAWYCAFDSETFIGEVSYHMTRELEAVGRFENITDYAELIADFFSLFHDLRAFDIAVESALHRESRSSHIRLDRVLRGNCGSIPQVTESSIPRYATLAAHVLFAFDPTWSKICGRAASGVSNGGGRRPRPSRVKDNERTKAGERAEIASTKSMLEGGWAEHVRRALRKRSSVSDVTERGRYAFGSKQRSTV
jgi:hypothetical protein